ncbi:sensor histidine kinase [Segetibacter koreensis]|uniref:sensor histidine kinase n=1 Tax=Segetibacter koreensis TaxID=398037 RepID=UPI000686B0FE|nr:two-component regulator propeller domain-containing protein [Segetibacter koreensis]
MFLLWNNSIAQIPATYVISSDAPGLKILTLIQHSSGYFLAGTTNGLYRFDGHSFTPFALSTQIKNKSITAIAEDKNSLVWIGFQSGEIGFLKNKTVELLHAEEGHPAVAITSILADTSGRKYFSTAGEGIYYYKNKRFYNSNTDDGLSDNYVYKMVIEQGHLVASTDRGLNIIDIGKSEKDIHFFTSANGLPDNIVRYLYLKNNNAENNSSASYWIGMQDKGIASFSASDSTFSGFIKDWSFGQVNSLITSGRQLWIATQDKGIVVVEFADASMNKILAVKNIYTNFAKANNLICDDEGNIWFTSNNQLIKTNGARLQNIIPFDKKIYSQIHSILKDRTGNIWVNVNKGLRRFYFDSLKQQWRAKSYILSIVDDKTDITSLYEDKYGNIWVGTMGKGIIIIDPVSGKNRHLTEDNLLVDGSVLSITGKDEELWISSLGGAVHCNLGEENKDIFQPYSFINFKNVSSIGSNYIYSILVDSKKRVWFATDGRGITVYDHGIFTNYNQGNGIKSLVIYNVCEDKNGSIWFSTLNNGLYKFDGKNFENISVEQGLNDATITALTTDAKNNIIAISKKGINIINAATNSISYLDINQGLEEVNTDLNCVAGNDEVYIVGNKGIMRYLSTEKSLKPKIVLEGVQVFLNNVDLGQKRTFSYDENNLTFSYTGISFSHPDKIRYQYKLEGLSQEWINTKDNSLNIPKLPPGNYTFRVKASISNEFDDSYEASYSFLIQKPLWLQWWFIAMVLLALGLLLYLLVKERVKRIKRWERSEKEKVQSQFETLKSQVNPHFLFNSFNTLISVIEEDQQKAVEYVEHLSDLYRKIVTYRDKDVITLKEEIEISNDYFFIQKKRFGDNLQFKNNVSEQEQELYMIAPLTLQMLTENAVKHNAISSETPLVIEIAICKKSLLVKNNINAKRSFEKGAGMGLQNIEKRYKLLTNEEVTIKKTDESFIVKIPLLTSDT